MKLKDDPEGPLSVERVAERAAILAQVCESIERDEKPIYIVGSEVPIPGGATDDHDTVQVTSVEDFENQLEAFSKAFKNKGLEEAWERVIAFVVQPGVEFGNDEIIDYEREKAVDLTNALKNYNQLAFEGHSTDYQLEKNLRQMVEDGVAILKVGPGLTFALREALHNIEMIEKEMLKESGKLSNFSKVIEKVMNDNPDNWIKHYHGSEFEKKIQRKYSFSDRVRYYLNEPEVEKSIEKLFENIETIKDEIPLGVISQYIPNTYMKIRKKELSRDPKSWVIDSVKEALDPYVKAT
jgi:D-tagatose-1,6-bisphosphate aldolase subunit GatZ/KbaZ